MVMTAEERYDYDPVFRLMVDTIYKAMMDKRYTPSEVRDAAMLAAVKYEMEQFSRKICGE